MQDKKTRKNRELSETGDFRSFSGSTRNNPPPSVQRGAAENQRTTHRPSIDNREKKNNRQPTGTTARSSTDQQRHRRKKKHMSRKKKIAMSILIFFTAFIATAFIGVFLVFKVDTILVSGDKVYEDSEIIAVCGYQEGDNLFFLSTTDKEEKLKKELPYIKAAKIKRKIPGTIEIQINKVKACAVVQSGHGYTMTDVEGKIINIAEQNEEALMVVSGADIYAPKLSEKISFIDEAAGMVYGEIIKAVMDLNAETLITKVDLSNLSDIKLIYENRVEMWLGNMADLTDKITLGVNALKDPAKISENASGVLKLQWVKETNRSYFEDGEISEELLRDIPVSSQENVSKKGFASNPGRGDDIPNEPYTGTSSDRSGTSSEAGSDEIEAGEYEETGLDATEAGSYTDETGNESEENNLERANDSSDNVSEEDSTADNGFNEGATE